MSSLSDQITFGLDVMVEAQRGMSTAEAMHFLRTGELPDLSQPPAEDVEPPEPDVLTPDEALRFLAGEQLTAAAGFLVPSSLHCELPGREAFKFDPNQPRDSEGRWSEVPGTGVDVPKVAAPGKKVLPAVIYKKHADGAVVARRGDRRLRWDAGGKKFVAEEREGGDWVEREQLTKTAAYNEMKNGEWAEPGDESVASPSPGKKLIGPDALRRDSAVRAVLMDKNAFMATHGFGGVPNDIVLEALAEKVNFTGKPDIRSKSDVDDLVNIGSPELLKAFRETTHRDNFTDGPYYAGVGNQGNGSYFHYRDPEVDIIQQAKVDEYGPKGALRTDEELAAAFGETVDEMRAGLRKRATKNYNRLLENTRTYGEHVVRGALRSDVEIKSLEHDILPAQQAYLTQLNDERAGLTDASDITELDLWIKAMQDPGRFATASGVQAYYGTTPNELVLLDRSGLVLQDAPPTLVTQGDLFPETLIQTSSQAPESTPAVVEPTAKNGPDTAQIPPGAAQNAVDSAKFTGPAVEIPSTLDQSLVDEYLALAAKHTVSDKMYDASAPGLTPDENVRMYELSVKIGEQSDDTVRNRIEQLGKIEGALNAWRAEHGVTDSPSALKKQLADSVRKHFAGKKIGMRVTEPALAAIIASGRVKSQFETNTSGGWNNPKYRAKYEAQWFGIGQGLDPGEASQVAPEKRPIYGYVMLDGVRPARKTQQDVLSFYGDIQVVLRDNVRKRTTAMFGDSLNEQNYGMPSPVDDPTWESFTPQPGFNPKSPVQMPLVQRDRDPKSQIFRQTAYAEAQIHDGVTVADIEEVIFPSEPSDAQREMLDAAGVAWRVVSGETAT